MGLRRRRRRRQSRRVHWRRRVRLHSKAWQKNKSERMLEPRLHKFPIGHGSPDSHSTSLLSIVFLQSLGRAFEVLAVRLVDLEPLIFLTLGEILSRLERFHVPKIWRFGKRVSASKRLRGRPPNPLAPLVSGLCIQSSRTLFRMALQPPARQIFRMIHRNFWINIPLLRHCCNGKGRPGEVENARGMSSVSNVRGMFASSMLLLNVCS